VNPNTPTPEWIKTCTKDETNNADVCSVANYLFDPQGNIFGQVRFLEVTREKEKRRVIEAMLPPGFLIPTGINLVVDDAKSPIPGRYRVCYRNSCLTEVLLSDDALASIRKGQNLTFFVANPRGEWMGAARIALAGFSAVYDGKPLDPKVVEEKRKAFEESQNKLQNELAKRAEEQRKKLQEGAAAADPAAAPAAPAAPAKTQ
jgi:invasion protein IalB